MIHSSVDDQRSGREQATRGHNWQPFCEGSAEQNRKCNGFAAKAFWEQVSIDIAVNNFLPNLSRGFVF